VSGQYYNTYFAPILVNNTFTIDLPLYNGNNYISLTDGINWAYVNTYTDGGTIYTAPIYNVRVNGAAALSGGTNSESWGYWETTAATATISGNAATGTGSWSLSGPYSYYSGTLDIAGGAFSIPVDLDNGNNYLYLYDAAGNTFNANIYSSGGYAPVKSVSITTPAHNSSSTVSTIFVSGNISLTQFTDYQGNPATVGTVYAYSYDYATSQAKYYSSNPDDQTFYGDLPIAYNTATGDFSFNVPATSGNMTGIEVNAYDTNFSASHGDRIYVNNYSNYSESFWKPNAKPSSKDARAKAHKAEFMKRMQRSIKGK
jgi:hypothetical protein